MEYSIMLSLYLFAAVSALAMVAIAIYVRQAPKSLYFSFLFLVIFIWNFSFLFVFTADSFETAFRAVQAQYMASPYTPAFLLLFACDYCGVRLKKYQTAALFIFPLIASVLVWTWPLNGIYYHEVLYVTDVAIPYLKITGSAFYYIFMIYNMLVSLATILVQLYHCLHRDRLFRKQAIINMTATVFPNLGLAFHVFHLGSPGVETTPIFLSVACILMAYSFLRLGLYRIAPIAREQIVENMNDGFILIDMNGCFVEANSMAKRLFPQLKGASMGIRITEIEEMAWLDRSGAEGTSEFSVWEPDEGNKYYSLSETEIMHANKVICRCIMIYDATDSKKRLDEVSLLAECDALTELSNRRALYQRGEQMLHHRLDGGMACALMIDIDFFKNVNDSYGHLKGDEVLRVLAQHLAGDVRKTDIVARYGGEEFCILLPDISEAGAIKTARKLQKNIAGLSFVSDDTRFSVTVSMGIAAFDPARHSALEALLSDADDALYAAKYSGRNTIYAARIAKTSQGEALITECVADAP